jgi:hypothetical protein
MNGSARNKNRRQLARRLVAGLALAAYVIASAGFMPLPLLPHKKKSGTPFPCQDHPCGCSSAEECWTHCCCFSVEERWAWAAAHRIEPPAYAERPASSSHEAHKSCCAAHASDRKSGVSDAAPLMRPLVIVSAARCQDLHASWVSVSAVLPILPGAASQFDRSPSERVSYAGVSPILLSLVPPDPPPRAV